MMRGTGIRRWLLLTLLLLAVAASYPGLIAHFSTRLPKTSMDILSHLGNLNWQNHFLLREPGLVCNLGSYYPHALATFFGPPMFGIAPWFGLFKLLGLNTYVQYNLFIVIGFLIGALGVFFLSLEVSGNERRHAFVAAFIYIAFNTQRNLFHWLPLFSSFFVPWTLLYFLRYLKTRQRLDLGLFLAFAAAQFITSVYLGVYLLAFFLPWMVLFALLFRKLPLRNFLEIAVGLALLAAVLLAVYHPIVASYGSVTAHRAYHPAQLLNVSDLFTANRSYLYGEVLHLSQRSLFNWFPGLTVFFLFFISGVASMRAQRWPWLAFAGGGLLGVLFLQKTHSAWATVLFLFLLAVFAGGHLRRGQEQTPLALMALSLSGYLLVFFNLLTLGLPRSAHPFSLLASVVPYFQRMCEYKRVVVILVPLLAVFAAHGLLALGGRRRWLPLLALGLIWVENAEPGMRKWGRPLRVDNRAPIYAAIPRQSDKVLLELPFFGGERIWSLPSFYQSIYVYSTRFHWNFIVNGRDSFAPLAHQELAGRATIPQVFTEENIEWLKRRYAVEYLIINWPLLTPREFLQARTRLPFLASRGDMVSASPQATVFRLREKKEITLLERTYSAYHLRHRQILVSFRKRYTLSARVAVAGRPWKEFRLNDSRELRFRVDRGRIGRDCESLRIDFSEPVGIEEIALSK
jgi:hypothetical protein